MARAHVLKVGPMEDGRSVYVPVGHEGPTELDPVEAADDLAGLAGLLDQKPHEELVCSPELARAAGIHGLRVEEPPALFEGMRVRIGMQFAQGDEFDQVQSSWAHLFLMRSVQSIEYSRIIKRWPAKRAFDVQMHGDRSDRWSGVFTAGAEPVIVLVRSRGDADALAAMTAEERTSRLATLDHLAVRLVKPPAYVAGPMRDLYGAERMPWFDIREGGERRMANDEDAFVIAGVFEALATIDRADSTGESESKSPERTVRTIVGATLDASGSRVD